MVNEFSASIFETHQIYGLQWQVKFKKKYLPKIVVYFNDVDTLHDIDGDNDYSSFESMDHAWNIHKMAVVLRKCA